MSNVHHNINGNCTLIGCPQCKAREDKFISMPLHELIEASEPKIFRWHQVNREQFSATPIGCDYVPHASFDRMKQIAVELAKACEIISNDSSFSLRAKDLVYEADTALSKCRELLGEK